MEIKRSETRLALLALLIGVIFSVAMLATSERLSLGDGGGVKWAGLASNEHPFGE